MYLCKFIYVVGGVEIISISDHLDAVLSCNCFKEKLWVALLHGY
jgi:hypothetical protein